jgi:2,4-diketo-3-deoxy-L-fuconate hydrolase
VPFPLGEPGLDWEVELAAIVGRPLSRVDPETALGGILGYAAFNDLSAREHQMHSRLWTLGKNADFSGPLSPVVTSDEVGDPGSELRLVTRVNGEIVQDGDTVDMIFSVDEILSYLSEVMTLNPGAGGHVHYVQLDQFIGDRCLSRSTVRSTRPSTRRRPWSRWTRCWVG